MLPLLLSLQQPGYGQNSVGIGTETPNPRAVLHLVSPNNNQGLLIPVMTSSERTAEAFITQLSASDNGLLVFDAEENTFYYWANDQWMALVSGSVGGDLSGPLSSLRLNEQVVTLENLADSSVVSSTIVDNSIMTTDIQSPGANKVLISTDAGTVFWENLNLFETVSLSQGFVYVGSTSNAPLEVDMRAPGSVLVGNGTTATAVTVSGDLTLGNDGVTEITDEAILDEDISATAGIAVAKLQSIPTGNIVYGNAEGVATVGAISGDVTLNEAGQAVLTNSAATRSNLGLDQSNVTITGGTIDGTTIGPNVQISGDGSGITDLDATNISSGVVAVDRLPNVTASETVYGDGTEAISSITVDNKGRVTAATVGTPSDRRLKRDWVALTHSSEKLQEITPYTYFWKSGDAQPQVGVMAQEVEKVFPQLVHTRSDGYKTVNYTGLIPPMLNVIQEQQRTIDALKEQALKQERENEATRAALEEIRQLLEQQK